MPNNDGISQLLSRWAFLEQDADVAKNALDAAQDSIQNDPKSIIATALIALSFLEKGMMISAKVPSLQCKTYWSEFNSKGSTLSDETLSDGSSEIKVSTLCLFATVIFGAFTGYNDFSVNDTLTFTQEALRRAEGVPKVIPSGTVPNLKIKTRVREDLRQILILARIRAIAKLSQFESAKKDALQLLPTIFLNKSLRDDGLKLCAAGKDYLPEPGMETFTELGLSIALDSTTVKSIKLRLAVGVLESTKSYQEVVSVCTSLIAVPSWVLAKKAWCSAGLLIEAQNKKRNSLGTCQSHNTYSTRNVLLDGDQVNLVIRELQAALRADSDLALTSQITPLIRFRIGACLFLAGGRLRANSFTFLSESVKEQQNSEAFTYLGHYFYQEKEKENSVGGPLDEDKAAKCYIGALKLNPLNEEAGWALSEIYMSKGEAGVEKAFALWEQMLSLSTHAFWCYPLLGQYYLCKGVFDKGEKPFQKALELHPLDAVSWYGLGFCYFSQGAFVAAERAFLRASELCPRDRTVLCLLGDARQKLCLLPEALDCYNRALDLDSRDAPALKGRADVNLSMAYQLFAVGSVGQVARVLAEGIRSVETILQDGFRPTVDVTDSDRNAESLNPNERNGESLRSVWKVLGDLCSFARNIGPADVALFIAPNKSEKNVPKDYEYLTLSGLGTGDSLSSYVPLFQVLEKGENAYRKILKIAEDSGSVDSTCLFDVGCALYFRAVVIQQSLGQGSGVFPPSDNSPGSSQDLLNQAKEYFVRGLRIDPLNNQCWNGLGLTLSSGTADNAPAAAQACFVRATQIEADAPAFANLGVLLMKGDKDDSARKCFSALQLIEANPVIWASLGCIFERMDPGSDSVDDPSLSQTMNLISANDSYIASVEIAKPTEALIGTALSWLKTHGHLNTSSMGCASVSGDGFVTSSERELTLTEIRHEVEGPLLRFLRRRPVHPLAWMHLAWCYEARGAVLESLRSLRTAMRALDKILFTSSSTSIPPSSSSKEDIKMAENILILFLRNYRRCQVKCLFYESRTTDGSVLEDASIVSWVGSLENVVGVLGIDRLKALAGIAIGDMDAPRTQYLSEHPGILKVQDPIEKLEKFANKTMNYLTLEMAKHRTISRNSKDIEVRSANFSNVQELLKDLLQCLITIAKASITSNSLCGLLVRFVCFCNTQLTSLSSQAELQTQEGISRTFHREIEDNLRSFATANSMDTEDYPTKHTEHTVLQSFLSTSPQSIYTLSKTFTFPHYSRDSQYYTTSIIILRSGIDKWHHTNIILNLELASQLFKLWDMKDKDNKDERSKGKEGDKEEEEKISDLLDDSYKCAVIAVDSAFNRLQLSLPESGADSHDLSLEGKKEMADLLCVEQSAAPRVYQEATELVYRIDSIRTKRDQEQAQKGGGGETEDVTQLKTNVLSRDSYKQYLRGIHWMPSLASYTYLK